MAILLSKSAEKAPKPTKSTSVKQHSFGLGSKVSGVDRLFFTEQLALLIETGMPLMQSLGLLAEQTENGAMRSVVRNLEDSVANGNFSWEKDSEPFLRDIDIKVRSISLKCVYY